MKTLDLIKKTSAYLGHLCPAMAVVACLAVGNVHAYTATSVIDLGAFNSGGTYFAGGALVKKINLGALPTGAILRSVTMNYRQSGGNPYLGDLSVLVADNAGDNGVLLVIGDFNDGIGPKTATPTVLWASGEPYGVGVTGNQTLTAADGIPTTIDLHDQAVWLQTNYPGTWEGSVTLEYDVGKITLNMPADTQAYPSGTSITASADVVVETGTADSVTFHTTPVSPAGATVDTVSADSISPFTAVLGTLAVGTYSINATVTSTGSFPGTVTSTTHTFTVEPAVSTTTTVAATSTSTYGQSVTFTATVAPTPTGGTVQFYDNGSPLGSAVAVDTGTGIAAFSVNSLGVGTHPITANYSGEAIYIASTSANAVSQVVDKAPLTVQALNTLRAPNTENPDPLPYLITGYQNGESLATSGVTGTPTLTTTAILSSPVGDYPITAALGDLDGSNYSFTLVNGTLTVAVAANTFSVNFYASRNYFTAEQTANLLVPSGVPAGKGDFFTSGWLNFFVPFGVDALPAVTLSSNQGSAATLHFNDARNGAPYGADPRTTFLGDGNYNMMDGHVNSTLEGIGNKFEMEMTDIPFATYDVIFYLGANLEQFGNGEGVIVFNGGADRNFKLKPGAFDGTFTEMVDATTEGNYIVFKNVTGSSFTTTTYGLGDNGLNHVGPFGFQIKEVITTGGYSAWQTANNTTQTIGQDLDNDGVANGIEYFINGSVANSSFTALPAVTNIGGVFKITFTHAAGYLGTYGTDFRVETSTTLAAGSWTAATSSGSPNVPDMVYTSGNDVIYTFPSGPLKKFARLVVTGP